MSKEQLTVESVRRTRKSWADQQGIKTGVMGEIVDGITISEANRATVYEKRREGIQVLRKILYENYISKELHAVLFGVQRGDEHHYAVFVEDGFLTEEV